MNGYVRKRHGAHLRSSHRSETRQALQKTQRISTPEVPDDTERMHRPAVKAPERQCGLKPRGKGPTTDRACPDDSGAKVSEPREPGQQ